jgi:hypothetical protein
MQPTFRSSASRRRAFQAVIALTGLAGLLIQFQITHGIFVSRGLGLAASLPKFASYFTILTNALLVTGHAVWLFAPSSKAGRFFARPSVQGGLLLYIGIVGVVYGAILASLWSPAGIHWWADSILHRITPLLQLGFWIIFVPKIRLPWHLALTWLVYPAAYLGWALAYGSRGGGYPYPFIDLGELGPARTLVNCGWMTLAFLAGGLLLIGVSRFLAKRPGSGVSAEGV